MIRMKVKHEGRLLTVAQAAAVAGISVTAMNFRLHHGWPKERLFAQRSERSGGPRPGYLEMALSGMSADAFIQKTNEDIERQP